MPLGEQVRHLQRVAETVIAIDALALD